MPINLTQELTFETDTIESFAAVLLGVIPVLFNKGCVVEPATAGDRDEWPSRAAAFFLKRHDRPDQREPDKLLHFAVCKLSEPSPYPYRVGGNPLSPQDAVNETVRQIQAIDPRAFVERCGQRGPFAAADGGVGLGYRLHHSSPRAGPLSISLCHIYYSK